VIGSRRAYRRPYFFEWFVAAQMLFVYIWVTLYGPTIRWLITSNIGVSILAIAGEAIVGVLIRYAIESYRGKRRRFARAIFSVAWMTDTIRLAVFGGVLVGVYGAIKLVVPIYNHRLYDRQLWEIDSAMCGGYAPVVFVVSLFSSPRVLTFFDQAYARIFFSSLNIAFTYVMSHPSRRVRVAFSDGNALMWSIGAWLYLLIPSLGPAYFFPDVWIPIRSYMPVTNVFHAALIANYQNMLKLMRTGSAKVTYLYGVAAFPSLHVAFQTFVFAWMRRLWVSGQVLFGAFMLIILIGSMITGWHYLVDGIAGIALAALSYWIPARTWRIRDWARLRDVTRR
jgi:hypothetical protein